MPSQIEATIERAKDAVNLGIDGAEWLDFVVVGRWDKFASEAKLSRNYHTLAELKLGIEKEYVKI